MFGVRWQPVGVGRSDWSRLQNEIDRKFERLAGKLPRGFAHRVYPALNLWEDDQKLWVEAEMPGFELDELEIYVNGAKQLTIKGERKQAAKEGGVWHRQERSFGKFERSLELPHDVDADKVSADLKQGVLTITLPKREEDKPRRIAVKVS
ncbi:MAG: Hsp20/alpha crystallin family protein [Pirellulaceae bacterium]